MVLVVTLVVTVVGATAVVVSSANKDTYKTLGNCNKITTWQYYNLLWMRNENRLDLFNEQNYKGYTYFNY